MLDPTNNKRRAKNKEYKAPETLPTPCETTTKQPYDRSPRRRRASWRSFGWMVTRLAWMAAKLVSSNKETR